MKETRVSGNYPENREAYYIVHLLKALNLDIRSNCFYFSMTVHGYCGGFAVSF